MIERWGADNPQPWGAGMVRFQRDEQLRDRENWSGVGDREVVDAAMHTLVMRPRNATTETVVNQLMPIELQWLGVPGDEGRVVPAGGRF